MKPLGTYLLISGTHGEPAGVDDDYDWHVQQAASARAAAAVPRRNRLAALPARLRALGRWLRSRPGEPATHRI